MKNDSFMTRHLHHAGEGYFEHMLFPLKMAGRLVVIAFVVFVHAIFPFLFTRTGSNMFNQLHDELQQRLNMCEADKHKKGQ